MHNQDPQHEANGNVKDDFFSEQTKICPIVVLFFFFARLCFDWEELRHDGVPLQLAPVDERGH